MLESYTEINGALRTKKFREVLSDGIQNTENISFEHEAQNIYEANQEVRDMSIVLSQFMRSFSAVYEIMDVSALEPEVKAGIDAMIAEMNKYTTLGDSVFADYGMSSLTNMLERQSDLEAIYNNTTEPSDGQATVVDVYKGLKKLGETK